MRRQSTAAATIDDGVNGESEFPLDEEEDDVEQSSDAILFLFLLLLFFFFFSLFIFSSPNCWEYCWEPSSSVVIAISIAMICEKKTIKKLCYVTYKKHAKLKRKFVTTTTTDDDDEDTAKHCRRPSEELSQHRFATITERLVL